MHDSSPTLDRYELIEEIGRGAQGRLYHARSAASGDDVAIKEMDLGIADDWKAIELFERESDILQSLDHPGIPSYIDAFHDDDGDATRFFLVQEFIAGEPLNERVERGDLMDEAEARGFLRAFLPILSYLHSMSPPVVHRDIKPSNVIVRPGASPALVDFGAVQTILPDEMGGSTVVGTSGFMPPEQLMGRAVPASDVYATAAMVVQLLSGHDPEDLPMRRMRMQFHDYVDASDEFLSLLEAMLDPTVEARVQDGAAVIDVLEGRGAGGVAEVARDSTTSTELEFTDDERARLERALEQADDSARSRHDFETLIDVAPERLEANIGPVEPALGNWMVPGGFVGLSLLAIPIAFVFPASLCAVPSGLILAGVSMVLMGNYLRAQSERLTIDHEQAVIEHRVHHWFGDGADVERHTFPVSQLYLPHVHQVDLSSFDPIDRRHGRGIPETTPSGMFGGKQGVILTDTDGNKQAFGELIIGGNRFINTASTMSDNGELEWLGNKIAAYLTFVRGGFKEEHHGSD